MVNTFVRDAVVPLLLRLGLAAVFLYHGSSFDIQNKGWEYNFVLIVVCVAVILLGSGPIGVDRWLGFRRRPRV